MRSAHSRMVAQRRARCRAVILAVAVLALLLAPSLTVSAQVAIERHILAEVRGDTAQDIAIRVGRALRDQPSRVTPYVSASDRQGGCQVEPLGIPVSCEAVIRVESTSSALRVTVDRRGERFVYDSSAVRL